MVNLTLFMAGAVNDFHGSFFKNNSKMLKILRFVTAVLFISWFKRVFQELKWDWTNKNSINALSLNIYKKPICNSASFIFHIFIYILFIYIDIFIHILMIFLFIF